MSAVNATAKITERLVVKATADLPVGVFVTYGGAVAGAGVKAIGVTNESFKSGELASVVTRQTALIKVKENVAAGDLLASDENGFAVKAVAGNYVNAIALSTASSDSITEVELVKYKI